MSGMVVVEIQSDGNARVHAVLVDEHGFQRWGSAFTQPLSAISALESSIADAVASAIQGIDSTASPGTAGPLGTQSPRAWQSYLLARGFMQKRPPGWSPSALRELEASVDADAGFAEAQAAYAVALALSASYRVDRRELLDRAASAASRAQVLAPDSSAVLAARGLLLQLQQPPDLATSELVLRRAVGIDPANVDARNWLQSALSQMGRVAEAQQVLLATAEIDPLNPVVQINVAGKYAAQGAYASARAALDRLLGLPQEPNYLRYQFEALDADFGKLDDSLGWTLSEFEADPKALRNANAVERLAVSLGRLGMFDEAEHVMAVAMRVVLLPLEPSLSTDAYRYLWDGHVQAAGFGPFGLAPLDPELGGLRAPWFHLIPDASAATPYPPLAQIAFLAVSLAGGASVSPQNTAGGSSASAK